MRDDQAVESAKFGKLFQVISSDCMYPLYKNWVFCGQLFYTEKYYWKQLKGNQRKDNLFVQRAIE